MAVVLVYEDDVLRLICGFALQRKKECFYDELKNEWDMYGVDVFSVCLGAFNGHVYGVHVGYGVGHRNLEECY